MSSSKDKVVQVSHQEIYDMKNFIEGLNRQSKSLVVVEGKRDAAALKKIGFTGRLVEFHRFGGLIKFADSVAKYENLILLFDGDRKGKYLTAKTIEQLQHRTRIDLSFKKKLFSITGGKVRFIEQLVIYESYLI